MRRNEDTGITREKVFTALSIAGSDSGGCAGIQADLRTFSALGVHGMTAITSVTSQDTRRVHESFTIPAGSVYSQIEAVLGDIGADAVKTGMLPDGDIIGVAVGQLRKHQVSNLVVDPVMISTGGDLLVSESAAESLIEMLLPLAAVVTPNLSEAMAITGREVATLDDMYAAAAEIKKIGARSVLVKGGHLEDSAFSTDLFYDGESFKEYRVPRVATKNTHGSGCTLAAAIAAFLARGSELGLAVSRAKEYVTGAIKNSYPLGGGNGPLGHFY